MTPFSFSAATRAVRSDLISAAVALPSRIWAVMTPSSRMTGPLFQSARIPVGRDVGTGHSLTIGGNASKIAMLHLHNTYVVPLDKERNGQER